MTLPLASGLNHAGFLVIPVLHRWCMDAAAVLSTDLLAQLLSIAPMLRRPSSRGAVFILDGDRAGPRATRRGMSSLSRLDNRYRYSRHALPPPFALIGQSITTTRLISAVDPAADLWAYLSTLDQAGLKTVLQSVPGGLKHQDTRH